VSNLGAFLPKAVCQQKHQKLFAQKLLRFDAKSVAEILL
jgi:hypothetical protein